MTDSKPAAQVATPLRAVRIWDLPTRLFHWLLVLALVGLVVTGKLGGNALVWHVRLGLLVGALLVFRLVWGLAGGRWSRFASFVRGPAALLRYLRDAERPDDHFEVGHNPLGAASVLAMLAVLVVQVATGLLADDEVANTGPLNRFVSNATGLAATAWHKGPGQWLILALVGLHLGAIACYHWRGAGLIRPMLTGDKLLPAGVVDGVVDDVQADVTPSADNLLTRALALLLLAACAAGAVWIASLGG